MSKQKLSKSERSAIAKEAQKKRWAKQRAEKETPPHVTKEWTENYDPVCVPECPACEANNDNAVAPGLSGEPINQETFVTKLIVHPSITGEIILPKPGEYALKPEDISEDGWYKSVRVLETTSEESRQEVVGTPSPSPVATPPVEPVQKRPRAKRKPMPKPFGDAHSYAERRLAEAIKERAECLNKLAVLNAEIPSLTQIIKALKSTEVSIDPVAMSQMAVQVPQTLDPARYTPNGAGAQIQTPQIPQTMGARGGAMDFEAPQEDENQFLPSGGVLGGKWS